MTLDAEAVVHIDQCWGCNRLRIPKPWTPGTLPLLRSEGRLRVGEYLCSNPDCGANDIIGRKR